MQVCMTSIIKTCQFLQPKAEIWTALGLVTLAPTIPISVIIKQLGQLAFGMNLYGGFTLCHGFIRMPFLFGWKKNCSAAKIFSSLFFSCALHPCKPE